MSKESFYFSHDYNAMADDKIKKLIRNHGMVGYGIFWAIIEDLYNNANALRKDYEGIAYDLRVDSKVVESIINDFDLFVFENGSFGSISIERRLDERNEKSEKARQSAFKRWNKIKQDANAMPTQCECNAIKDIKESKVKESKGKDLPDKPADFIDLIVNCFVEEHGNYEIVTPGKEREMAAKILGIYKKKFPAATSEEVLTALRIYFNQCVNINDDWLRNNMSLSTIVSKFNPITKILKNGTAKKIGTTNEQLIGSLEKGVGTEFLKGNAGK